MNCPGMGSLWICCATGCGEAVSFDGSRANVRPGAGIGMVVFGSLWCHGLSSSAVAQSVARDE